MSDFEYEDDQDNFTNFNDEEYVRPPEPARRMCLMGPDSNDSDTEPSTNHYDPDPEMTRAIQASLSGKSSPVNLVESDLSKAIKASLEEYEASSEYSDEIDPEILRTSAEEYENEKIKEELALIEAQNQQIIAERSSQLQKFIGRVTNLNWSEDDKQLKAIILPIINDWQNNKFDNVTIDTSILAKITAYLRSLYDVPKSRGRAPAISEEEYNIIRTIFIIN